MLELKGITKEFPGTRALDQVTIDVKAGEVLALLGENGAGKSTLMKILSGVWPAGSFEGEIRVGGTVRHFADTRDAHAAGIAMIHQELAVFPELSVAEHLELDRLPTWISWDGVYSRAQTFLDTLGLGLKASTRVGDLSVGGRQLVEIARALYRDARVLVFDEPTSALTETEVVRLYSIIDKLRAEGRAMIYITHRMDEVFRLADRMIVLRDGKNAGSLPAKDEQGQPIPRSVIEPKVVTMMVGRAIEDIYPPHNDKQGDEILRVENLTLKSPKGKLLVKNLSFKLRAGEVLGLAGLLGAGRSETFEAIFGVLNGTGPRGPGFEVSGNIWIKGNRRPLRVPRDAIGARLAFVSEDRKGSGLVLNQSIRSNMMLPCLTSGRGKVGTGIWVDEALERAETDRVGKEMRVKAASFDQAVGTLSGGNQQKVVIAKWLLTEPEVLFLDEPTRGIDVGAKVEIYQLVQRLASQGLGIMVASSEMPELLGLCHRVIVLREGGASAEFMAAEADQESIMRAASL